VGRVPRSSITHCCDLRTLVVALVDHLSLIAHRHSSLLAMRPLFLIRRACHRCARRSLVVNRARCCCARRSLVVDRSTLRSSIARRGACRSLAVTLVDRSSSITRHSARRSLVMALVNRLSSSLSWRALVDPSSSRLSWRSSIARRRARHGACRSFVVALVETTRTRSDELRQKHHNTASIERRSMEGGGVQQRNKHRRRHDRKGPPHLTR
jgi:hypothetical protein